MKVIEAPLDGCLIIEPEVYSDSRGFFYESFHVERYRKEAGLNLPFVQDNFSYSERGVLRGLHFQRTRPQGKLVRVTHGESFDVAVDIRRGSTSFGQWYGLILSAENRRQFWMPPGFAHGFLALSETLAFEYKCTDYYQPEDEGGIAWDDPELAIQWPLQNGVPLKLSVKDSSAPMFSAYRDEIFL
ncbi:dTDP-4-dehydrorhamnose 3,5-epimerase [Spongiibacter sp. KMU-158]|uniref:dTDP-4-dehydrorhamnose 3,5-epimerase n=1 Tax=Spongiibacter pelagi TaxID=2760804 RepID=A0A927GW60_9GAMM|nr:dTDP-4-dehydrorhamnose 3,5-epimerase [Spongiibacter pelagi]MBD2859381.1 dTDP-4-dehydrorhamnose 3,5-epimerase [Spongiibacter pelagi]